MKNALLAIVALLALPVAAQVDDYRDLKYPELPLRKLPSPERHTLPNGLQLLLVEDHELPLISVSGRIRTGTNYEPAAKAGLADFVGQVMREGGTTSMSGDDMDDWLESRAASVETGMTGDFGTASMNCLSEQFDEVFDLFVDVLRHPAFAEDKLELAKQQARTAIARRNDSISGIAGREFSRLIHGYDSPLSQMMEYATVAAISRDDLVDWHARYYHPNNIMLGVVGDFDSAKMKARIEAAFADWPRGPDADLPQIPAGDPEPGVYFIEKSDVTQAYISLGHLGIRADSPDYYAVELLNEVLGGGSTSRLFGTVRSEKGLAYSVGGGVGAGYLREGTFSVGLSTKSETMAAALDALREEIEGIIARPPTDAEIDRARETIFNSFVFNSTSTRQILGQQLTYAYYGYPADFLERYRSGLAKVGRDDVARVAGKYIHPDRLVTLVVGKSEDFDRPLSEYGDVRTVDITIAAPEASGPEFTRNEATLAAGRELWNHAAAYLNGGESPVQSIDGDYALSLKMAGQTMSLGQRVTLQFPDKMRQTLVTPMGEQTVILNGGRGVALAGGQSRPIPESDIAGELEGLNRELYYMAGRVDDVEAVAGGETEIAGTACALVQTTLDSITSVLCVAADGRVLSQAYQGVHPLQGTPGELTTVFSDYREIDGYHVPYTRVLSFEGEQFATGTIRSIVINSKLDSSTFEVPE